MEKEVRVRFAPSPTGPLHIGGLRTAYYNYLFAKKLGGQMILRIEDTDKNRYVAGAEDYILKALAWCGINTDEDSVKQGPFAPYRQSERQVIYQRYADELIANGFAYFAFDTPAELDEMRDRLKEGRVANPQYNSITRSSMKNSLTLSREEVDQRMKSGEPYVVRLKVPGKEEVRFNDLIRGWVKVHSSTIDDKVLLKSDGMPTYHLANVVDDHLMKITHVIRGEEWLPSAPLHCLLYKFLGWEDQMPQFAHLPLLLKPDGNGKLSKRDAEKHGFPIFPLDYKDPETGETAAGFRESGYLPEAFLNFIAFLGWNPGTEKEMFTEAELIQEFSLERINKAGAKFDINKAKWFNQEYLKLKSLQELVQLMKPIMQQDNVDVSDEKLSRIAELMRGRITFPKDIFSEAGFLFAKPETYDQKTVAKKWTEEAEEFLRHLKDDFTRIDQFTFTRDEIHAVVEKRISAMDQKFGKVMPALRLATTGSGSGADLMTILEILGKNEVIERLNTAFTQLGNKIKI